MDLERRHVHSTFNLALPQDWTSPCIFSSPHSGADYPDELTQRSHLSLLALRSSEDAFVDELFAAAPALGAPLLSARLPRAWIDLNRAATELDPALISGAKPAPRSPRINAGLGVIPRVVSEGRSILQGKISLAEALSRIERDYRPYHDALRALISTARRKFGYAVLIDCHSMPHDAVGGVTIATNPRAQIVLGDRFGASCARWVTDAVSAGFVATGLGVMRNSPFAGGFITQNYGKPAQDVHAIQIEIDRGLYMDEATITRGPQFDGLKSHLEGVIAGVSQLRPPAMPVAAE